MLAEAAGFGFCHCDSQSDYTYEIVAKIDPSQRCTASNFNRVCFDVTWGRRLRPTTPVPYRSKGEAARVPYSAPLPGLCWPRGRIRLSIYCPSRSYLSSKSLFCSFSLYKFIYIYIYISPRPVLDHKYPWLDSFILFMLTGTCPNMVQD
jgi:hypothetical protein